MSNGTPIRESPIRPRTNKAGHGPRTGLGYQFDATLEYPGEGPSHSPFTRRGTKPSLRVWSTKRLGRQVVDPTRVQLDFSPIAMVSKSAHGNSDTRLGRWLHSVRFPPSTDLSPASDPRRDNNVDCDTTPQPARSASVQALMAHESSEGLIDQPAARSIPMPADTVVNPTPRADAMVTPSLSRHEFIMKFALQRGVNGAALDAIWRSNKRGYNASHDAHFDRFQIFFRDTKPDSEFTPLSILPGDLVSFLQMMDSAGSSFASIKNASASISMACREATDGDIALGDRESVKRFLKSLRIHAPVGLRKTLAPQLSRRLSIISGSLGLWPQRSVM